MPVVEGNFKNVRSAEDQGGVDNGGGPTDDDPMEARVAKLEELVTDTRERLVKIEVRLDQTATKSDLADGLHGMVKWIVGTGIALGAAGITVVTFVLNNATPKAPPAPAFQPAPIIIQVPSQPVTPPQAPAKK